MAISEVFQKMFFMIPLEELVPAAEKQFRCFVPIAHIQLDTLKLCLNIDWELAMQLTKNFMGIQSSQVTDLQIGSTVLEILNMLAGNFLNQIDPEGKYELGIPVPGNPVDGDISVYEELNFESHRLSVFLRGSIL
jgi:hypothetical protein